MTLTDRILLFVDEHPGRTAWDICKELCEDPKFATGTVSSLLCQLAKKGRLRRERMGMRGSWTYYSVTLADQAFRLWNEGEK